MRKGQLLIFTAVIIGFALSGILTYTVQLQLSARESHFETNPSVEIRRNIEKELIMLVETDPYNETRFERAIEDMNNSVKSKGIETDISWLKIDRSDLNPSECDFELDKSMTPLNSPGEGWRFNVVVKDPGQVKTSSNFKVCWN